MVLEMLSVDGGKPAPRVVFLFLLYMASSALMLVVNKGAVVLVPAPALLLFFQTLTSCIYVMVMRQAGKAKVKLIPERRTGILYFIVSVSFLVTIYSNMGVLRYVGVNAFVILRCSTPLLVAGLDWVFLGRELPNGRSTLSLVGIVGCAAMYVWLRVNDVSYRPTYGEYSVASGVFWGGAWLVIFLWDQIFIKHVVDGTKTTGMERVLYQNSVATAILMLIALSDVDSSESSYSILFEKKWSLLDVVTVAAPCIGGTMLSYAGLTVRSEITATVFTLAGVLCKLLSILINEALLNEEKNYTRLVAVLAAIGFSSMYREAPLRNKGGGARGGAPSESQQQQQQQPLVGEKRGTDTKV